jgi:integrase
VFGVSRARNLHRELLGLGLAPRSVNLYTGAIQTAERWFAAQGWHLTTATADQVAAYLEAKPNTFASRNLLRAAFKHYWELTGRRNPPLRAVRVPPKPAMVCRALDEEDARRLARAAQDRHDRHGLAVILGLYQGMRREEIATARWDAVREDGWLEITGKGSKRRTIPLHPVAVAALSEVLAQTPPPHEWVFPGRWGDHCTPATIWDWCRRLAAEAGVSQAVWTHRLRHTALATQNDATGDLRTVQAFAGHSRPEVTSGYTRATSRRLLAAVAALDY